MAQVSNDWLSASISGESLVLSLDSDAVVSGHHSTEVVLWDTDADAEAATVTVVSPEGTATCSCWAWTASALAPAP